jgi:hypothetical protein
LCFFLPLGIFPKFSKASAFGFSSPPYEPYNLGLVCVLRGVPPPELRDYETSKVSPISTLLVAISSVCEGTVPPEFSLSLNPPKGFSISALFAGSLHTTVLSVLSLSARTSKGFNPYLLLQMEIGALWQLILKNSLLSL